MPESTKCTLTELTAYYQASGEAGIRQRYPTQETFILVPVQECRSQPLAWTPNRQDTVRIKAIKKSSIDEQQALDKDQGYTAGRSVVVPINFPTMLGRDKNCSIRFTSLYISNQHALLNESTQGVQIKDLNSANGTSINGCQIDPDVWHNLSFNDEISLAGTKIMFIDFKFLCDVVKMLA